jgi:hypothetical protein
MAEKNSSSGRVGRVSMNSTKRWMTASTAPPK